MGLRLRHELKRELMRGFTGLLLLVFLFLVLSFRQGIALYVDWLWFQEVGYTQLFTTSLLYKLILGFLPAGSFLRCFILI